MATMQQPALGLRDTDMTSSSAAIGKGVGGSAGPSTRPDHHAHNEFSETRSIRLEWKVDAIRQLLDESNGQGVKSKCIKSCSFGDGAWQIYLYANSGSEPAYVSLYLSAEPTREERERGAAAQPSSKEWSRTGTFRFLFELRSFDARSEGQLFKAMEATDHAFDSASRNWGWASFIKRSDLLVRINQSGAESCVISCTITRSPSSPAPPPETRGPRKQLVPSTLVDAYAALFDEPTISDVVFVFPATQRPRRRTRRLYASKVILVARSEYFRDAFSGAWAELTDDEEDDEEDARGRDSGDESDATADEDGLDDDPDLSGSHFSARGSVMAGSSRGVAPESIAGGDDDDDEEVERAKTSTVPSSPNLTATNGTPKRVSSIEADIFLSPMMQAPASTTATRLRTSRRRRGPVRTRVVVTDTSYRTFRSLIYFLYTDSIRFAPLASLYFERREEAAATGEAWPWSSRTEWAKSTIAGVPASEPTTSPVGLSDAKAIYAVADRLILPELKQRAFEHIKRSLSPSIVAYEAFGSFSARFPEVQSYEVQVLLQHWPAVRASSAMRKVFAMLSSGQGSWSGFQDVWFSILTRLEYRSPSPSVAIAASAPPAE